MALTVAVCITLLCASFSAPAEVDALTKKNQKAHDAYEQAMQNGEIETRIYYDSFREDWVYYENAYYDINRDGYDELIQKSDLTYYIWTYHKGKVKEVVSATSPSVLTMSIYPKTRTILFKYREPGLHHKSDKYYKISRGEGKLLAVYDSEYETDGDTPTVTYYKKGKKVSRATYNAYVKSLKKGKVKKESRLKWWTWENT
jgi:hypothetical protein